MKRKLSNYIIFENPNCMGDGKYFIASRKEFSTMNFCATYGDYGQSVSCYDAGCYSLENSDSDFSVDMLENLNKKFSTKIQRDDLIDL